MLRAKIISGSMAEIHFCNNLLIKNLEFSTKIILGQVNIDAYSSYSDWLLECTLIRSNAKLGKCFERFIIEA